MRIVWKILMLGGVAVGGFVGGMVLQSVIGVKEKVVSVIEISFVSNEESLKQLVGKATLEHVEKLGKIMSEQKGALDRAFGRFKEKVDKVIENAGIEERRNISELINRYRINQDEKVFEEMMQGLRKRFDELEFRVGTTWADTVYGFYSVFHWTNSELKEEMNELKSKLRGSEDNNE